MRQEPEGTGLADPISIFLQTLALIRESSSFFSFSSATATELGIRLELVSKGCCDDKAISELTLMKAI